MPKASNDYDFDGFEGLNLLDPQHPQSAATKAWVEAQIAAGGANYALQDYERTGTYVYVGYENSTTNAWFIYRRTLASNVRQQASGGSNYATAWTNRETQIYV